MAPNADDNTEGQHPAVILDIDGTLVDTNYQHALAWYRAFRDHDLTLPIVTLHRHVGMGGDQLVPAVAGEEVDHRQGDAIREAEGRHYRTMLDEVACFEGARRLITALHERGHRVVLATSARSDEVDHYLELLDAREVADAWTTSEDVETTKPQPDLVLAAMEKLDAKDAVMVGDSTWDAVAARRAGLTTIGILTGGFSEEELREGGAVAVYESVGELLDHLGEPPLTPSPAR